MTAKAVHEARVRFWTLDLCVPQPAWSGISSGKRFAATTVSGHVHYFERMTSVGGGRTFLIRRLGRSDWLATHEWHCFSKARHHCDCSSTHEQSRTVTRRSSYALVLSEYMRGTLIGRSGVVLSFCIYSDFRSELSDCTLCPRG